MAEGALVNVGELAKPVTVLIEKISNAVGVIYEPTAIRRKASAQADALQILALGELAVTDLQQRAMKRLAHQEERKQANIESITEQAINALPETANAEALNEDWVAHFFKQCDTVSDKEMQALWAKLLAGEATSPGQFSKRTVDVVAGLEKTDANMFTQFAQFICKFGEPTPLIYNIDHEIYKKAGVTFSLVTHLEAIGLIHYQSLTGYQVTWPAGNQFGATDYFDEMLVFENPELQPITLSAGHCLLTRVGVELYRVCGAPKHPDFSAYVAGNWADQSKPCFSPLRAALP